MVSSVLQREGVPGKAKIDIATARFNDFLIYEVPDTIPITSWIPYISKDGDINSSEIFEYVYRCYHDSYKVVYMQSCISNFKNMIVYLFCKKVKANFLKEEKVSKVIGFPNPIEEIKLDSIFIKDSLTYKYVNDIISCKPNKSTGWEDWTGSHLTLMGGVFWSLISSISLLGMLQRYIKKDYKRPQLITYPDGVANYILYDINYEGLNK